MAGLKTGKADANPFGSKFADDKGGFDAGNGKRTYTKPSYTLFVVGIPEAESSDAVQRVFERDRGYLQCRPVGHKFTRRMVFVDYGTIDDAQMAMRMHQGHKWHEVDEGLKIDYDHDARSKRNTAMDEGRFEKFWPIAQRVAKAESDAAVFARLREMADDAAPAAPVTKATAKARAHERGKRKRTVGAKIQVKGRVVARAGAEAGASAAAPGAAGALGGLAAYDSESEKSDDDEDEDSDDDDDDEEDSDEGGESEESVSPSAEKRTRRS